MERDIPQLSSCLQHADDSNFYRDFKSKGINICFQDIQNHINKIVKWSLDSNLVFNIIKKTKLLLLATTQMIRCHKLNETIQFQTIKCNSKIIKHVKS